MPRLSETICECGHDEQSHYSANSGRRCRCEDMDCSCGKFKPKSAEESAGKTKSKEAGPEPQASVDGNHSNAPSNQPTDSEIRDEEIGIVFCKVVNEVRKLHPQLNMAQLSEVAAIRLARMYWERGLKAKWTEYLYTDEGRKDTEEADKQAEQRGYEKGIAEGTIDGMRIGTEQTIKQIKVNEKSSKR